MKLQQLKKIFTDAFAIDANAKNARQVLKDKGVSIVRKDFRCRKTWEQLLDAFGLLDSWRAMEKKRQQKKQADSFKKQQQEFIDQLNKQFATVGCTIPDINSTFWDDDYR